MLPVRFVAVRIVSHFRLVASLHFHSTFTTSISAPPRGNTSHITFYELFSGSTKMKAELLFKRLTEKAFVPTKGSERAAGFDLKSAYSVVVPAKGKALCMTDLQIRVPSGCYGRIAPRSGLAVKHFIDVGAGVIDEDYTGNVGVVLFNHSNEDFKVNEGDRIAQLICEMICYPELKEVKELAETARGDGGFGSTGQN